MLQSHLEFLYLIEIVYLIGLIAVLASFSKALHGHASRRLCNVFVTLSFILLLSKTVGFAAPFFPSTNVHVLVSGSTALLSLVLFVFIKKLVHKNTFFLLVSFGLSLVSMFTENLPLSAISCFVTGLVLATFAIQFKQRLWRNLLFLYGLYIIMEGILLYKGYLLAGVAGLALLNGTIFIFIRHRSTFKTTLWYFIVPTLCYLILAGTYYYSPHAAIEKKYLTNEMQQISSNLVNIQTRITLLEQTGLSFAKIAAGLPEVRNTILNQTNSNLELKLLQKITRTSVLYIIDKNGDVLASSGESFLGKNYSFRPYFQKALGGLSNIYYAKGITSNKTGIYAAQPIYIKGIINGVAVVKQDLDTILGNATVHDNMFIMHKNGAILLGDNDFQGHLLFHLPPEELIALKQTRQFGNSPFTPMGFKRTYNNTIIQDKDDTAWLMTKIPLPGSSWYLTQLHDLNSLFSFRLTLFGAFGGISILFLLVLLRLLFIKEMTRELALEHERLLTTVKSIGDAVICTDITGKIVLINTIAENLTGWTNKNARGQNITEVFKIIHETTRQQCDNIVEKVVQRGSILGLEANTVLIAKDGTERIIADSAAPIKAPDGSNSGVVIVFRDTTEQVKIENELLKIKKLESIGVLAGGIAHDFNNILVGIIGNITLARFDTRIKEKTLHFLAEAEKAAFRAQDLTQQLLTFSKGGEPIKETSTLPELIRDSTDFVLRGEKTSCEYSFPDDLLLVDIDKGQFSQVIQNIIINAKHAMPDGGTITVCCENIHSHGDPQLSNRKDSVQISITDNGLGVPANIIDKIFDPYFTTKSDGNGLGLATCYSIIKKHSGRITVQSRKDKGTTFTIILPASDHQKPHQTHQAQKQDERDTIPKAKIMIMDDDEAIRKVTKLMLTEFGHDVILAKDGAEAIQLFSESVKSNSPIDVTIMDLTIPGGMGGKDAVKELLKIEPHSKIIVSSGYSNDPIMAHCEEYGFCAALVKPFQLQELKQLLEQVLSQDFVQE
ncbi:response regulator [Desulfotalea psychrophila]|uniref:histidine kinase n=1 Tax=Desulfotalea psychrophila TaxID=84980 RepID=A0ABS3AUW4_9BACT|nr:response regulator [Desulfocapsa sp.]MBN4068310.1 response regulator [Desulfotalea psychrophila]MBN4071577.1 response regulator [Desulfotalea psychrophila]